jgi:glycosyltransferase involved in cell wall biosynthesis
MLMQALAPHSTQMPVERRATKPLVVLDVRVVTGRGGGPDKTILNSPRFLRPLGYEMLCAYMHPPGDPGWVSLCERAARAEAPLLSIPDRGALDPRVVTAALEICRRHDVAIWHGHDYKSNLLGLLLQPLCPMRLVTTVHGWGVQAARTSLYYRLDRWSLRYYEKVLCVSEDLYAECLRAGVAEENCVLLENGIDSEHFRRRTSIVEAKARFGIPANRHVIGAVGRLSPEKGFEVLLQALVRLRQAGLDACVLLVGEGEERTRLVALAAELRIAEHVHFVGHMDDPRPAYESLDAYALSSYREGMPNVVLEALAMMVPVVATHVAGVPRLIEHEVNGLLLEPGDATALAANLRRLLTDHELQRRLAEAGRTTIKTRFSFARRMERLAELYDVLLRRRLANGAHGSSDPHE